MKKLLLACTALVALTGAASASSVTLGGQTWTTSGATTLSLVGVVPGGNQPQNIPCLICGDNQPQQPANFGYNDFKNSGSLTGIQAFSNGDAKVTLADDTIGVGYTIGSGSPFLLALLAFGDNPNDLHFDVGVDINDNNTAQTLNSFFFLNLTQHTVLASFTGGTTGNVPSVNNGTGFPDYELTGFNLSRGDIALGDTILFVARMSDMNDGPDSFFLVSGVNAVPEPSTWAMMLLGFVGVGVATLRQRRKSGRPFRFV